jgi:2-keto-3-deoxy-L-rhamnonate aldolase RhmA
MMRRSKTLAKLRRGAAARICALGSFMPPYVRHAAHFGFDCIWLDLEHRAMDDQHVASLLALCRLYDIDCLVRSPTREKVRLYRYLEDGAAGLMIPHVTTAAEAHQLAQSLKFPPLGERGLDGAGFDDDYSLRGLEGYPEEANRETFLVVQIESPAAVEQAEPIAAVEGVDGLFVGPGDLGLRLKHAAARSLTLEQAIGKVAEAAAKHGKAWGLPARDAEDLRQYYAQGARLLAHGGEFMAVMNMLKESAARFDQALGSG